MVISLARTTPARRSEGTPTHIKGSEQAWISKPDPAEAARIPQTCLETSGAT